MRALSEEELSHIRSDQKPSPRISIVGIGGAGNKLLGNVIGNGGIGPEQCVAVNTDKGQLSRSLASNKVLLGEDIVDGKGVFGSVSVGRRALQLSAHRVTSFVGASDITIILVGFGGGTGTAAAPLVAQWARSEDHTSVLQSHSDFVCILQLGKNTTRSPAGGRGRARPR